MAGADSLSTIFLVVNIVLVDALTYNFCKLDAQLVVVRR